jgi:hypothetical protein
MKHSVGRWRQGDGARIVGICRSHFRLQGLAFALSAQLVILTGDFVQAEDRPSGPILSACRVPIPMRQVWKESPETKKGYTFILAATRFKFTGAYDRALEQIDQAVKVDPTNPRFYAERGAARAANHQLSQRPRVRPSHRGDRPIDQIGSHLPGRLQCERRCVRTERPARPRHGRLRPRD